MLLGKDSQVQGHLGAFLSLGLGTRRNCCHEEVIPVYIF